MKKFLKLFLLSFVALCLVGCPNPNTPPEEPVVDLQAEEKRAVYNEFIGTWETETNTVTFTEDSIILGDTSIPFSSQNITSFSNRDSEARFVTTLNETEYTFTKTTI